MTKALPVEGAAGTADRVPSARLMSTPVIAPVSGCPVPGPDRGPSWPAPTWLTAVGAGAAGAGGIAVAAGMAALVRRGLPGG